MPVYFIYAAIAVSLVLMHQNRQDVSPVRLIINRWLRWGIFATGFAYLLIAFGWSERPYWLLTLIFALLWFLGETLYNWMAIQAYSTSTLPLFPRYEASESGEEWPTQPRFLKMRDEIRAAGFTHLRSMRAFLIDHLHVRVSVYQDETACTRLQISFVPQPNGLYATIASFATRTSDGYRYVTDNTYMPYAGFYPENWLVERKPWLRSLARLLKYHRDRLAKNNETPEPDHDDPLDEMNQHQHIVEQLNIEMGFLRPHFEREEYGRITNAGRYRTWKELWMLNYFGKSMSYL